MAASLLQIVALIVAVVFVVVVGEVEIGAVVGVVVVALEPCVEVGVQFLKESGKIGFAVDAAMVQNAFERLAVKIPSAVGWVRCDPAVAFAGHCAGEVVVDERFAWEVAVEERPI